MDRVPGADSTNDPKPSSQVTLLARFPLDREVPITFPIESARRMVAWTSRVAGIRNLYASVYRAAVRNLVREVSNLEGALSIFTRNSYAAGTFIPGLSDIDVVLVIRDDLEAPMIKSLLKSLYHICARLRRRFPMLNPFPVFTRQGFILAYRLGPLRIETDAWQCEWGDEHLLSIVKEPRDQSPLETLTRGVQIYLRGFHGSLRASLLAGKTRSTLALERSVTKVERALGRIAPVDELVRKGSIPDVVASTLMATNQVLESFAQDYPPHSLNTIDSRDEHLPDVYLGPASLCEGIESIISRRNGSASSYILSIPVNVSAVEGALNMARQQVAGSAATTLTTKALFTFFLRHINPMAFYRLEAARNVRGGDVFERVLPPSEAGVRRYFCFEAAHMLRLPIQLGSGRPQAHRVLAAHQRRRERLFHFIEHNEILLDGNSSLSSVIQPAQTETLTDLMLGDMREVLHRLRDRPVALFPDKSGKAS